MRLAATAWQPNRQMLARTFLLIGCCCLVLWIHVVVADDTFSEAAAVGIQIAGLAALIGAVSATALAARRLRCDERVAARLFCGALFFVTATYVASAYSNVSTSLRDLTATPAASSTIVVLGPGGRDVRLSGDLDDGVTARVADLLDAHPEIERLHLTSEGGLAEEGEALRKLIAAHRLTTFVPDFCVSACTLAFLGGRERLIMSGARLGFHAPYEQGLLGQNFAVDSDAERSVYLEAGVASDFVEATLKVAPDDIWIPAPERLLAAHVITGVVGRYLLPDSNLDGNDTLQGARSALLQSFPPMAALAAERPDAVDAIASWYLDGYRRGMSEGRDFDGVHTLLRGLASLLMARADDDTEIAYARFIDVALQASKSEADCVELAAHPDLIKAETILEGSNPHADAIASELLRQSLRTGRIQSATEHGATRVDRGTAEAPGGSCAAMRGIYADILRLPRARAASRMRELAAPGGRASQPVLAALRIRATATP